MTDITDEKTLLCDGMRYQIRARNLAIVETFAVLDSILPHDLSVVVAESIWYDIGLIDPNIASSVIDFHKVTVDNTDIEVNTILGFHGTGDPYEYGTRIGVMDYTGCVKTHILLNLVLFFDFEAIMNIIHDCICCGGMYDDINVDEIERNYMRRVFAYRACQELRKSILSGAK